MESGRKTNTLNPGYDIFNFEFSKRNFKWGLSVLCIGIAKKETIAVQILQFTEPYVKHQGTSSAPQHLFLPWAHGKLNQSEFSLRIFSGALRKGGLSFYWDQFTESLYNFWKFSQAKLFSWSWLSLSRQPNQINQILEFIDSSKRKPVMEGKTNFVKYDITEFRFNQTINWDLWC